MDSDKVKDIVKSRYSIIAKNNSGCGCVCNSKKVSDVELTKIMGYSDEEISNVPEANMGLGCGNPLAFAQIKDGDSVLDLGCGGGFDVFLAARKVGDSGKVTGVDMTQDMIEKARVNAEKHKYSNVEFVLSDIESLPFEDEMFDLVTSNCVINLAPSKDKVFREAYRVLKTGGVLSVSDIVLLEELSEEQRADEVLIAGCVGGAILKDDYIAKVKDAGFVIERLDESSDVKKTQYEGFNLESLKLLAKKL